jgi:homoserine kinase
MRMIDSVSIRVPGTVGNFAGVGGCGALALDVSMNVKVTRRLDGNVAVRYFGEDGERVPRDGSNLVVAAMRSVLENHGKLFPGADVEIYNTVPVGAGFGSSAAAILSGSIAADRLFRLDLDEKAMLERAEVCESRAENIRAAWLGGFVARVDAQTPYVYHHAKMPEDCVLTAVIPAVRGHGIVAVEEALRIQVAGSPTIFLCGSGPAIGILAEIDPAPAISAVQDTFARHGIQTILAEYRPTNIGTRHWLDQQVLAAEAAELHNFVSKPTLIPV